MAKRGDWLKADPEKAREMGRKGGQQSAYTRGGKKVSPEYVRGYRSGFMAGKRSRLREHGMAARTI
jgi:general stress protein YciG